MATLITKNSSTASAVPAAGDLVKGELAVNVTDKKVYTKDNSAAVVKLVGSLGNQEANAVAITGGTINGTTIGATTPSTGAFTTASASSGFTGNLTGNVTGNVSGTAANVTGVVAIANGGTGLSALGTGVQSALGQAVTGSGSFVLSTSPSLTTPNLGTPSAAVLTNATGLPLTTGVTGTLGVANGGTGITAFGTGVATALGQNVTGSGGIVLATSPSLTTPNLGTPSAATLTNATGLPISTGVSGLGTGVATALGVAVGSAGAFVVNGGALGTPSSGTVTNLTGTASININGTVGATTPTTGAFTTLSASGNITVSGGTANGVAYLNGSKVLTTGSNLTFTGTLLKLASSALSVQGVDFAASGSGAEIFWDGTESVVQSYNRTSSAYLPLWLESSYTRFGISGSEAMRLTSTGLGIGTSSPTAKLTVSGGNVAVNVGIYTATNGGNAVQFGAAGQLNFGGGGSDLILATNGANVRFGNWNTNTEQMRLDSSGNLGIGTNSPGYKLQVAGTSATVALNANNASASSTSTVLFRNIDGNGNTYNIASIDGASAGNGGYGNLVFSTAFNTTNTERMRIDSSGNLGLGVTPNTWLNSSGFFGKGNIEFLGGTGILVNFSTDAPTMQLNANGKFSSGWLYKQNGYASRFIVNGSSGGFNWQIAPSGTADTAISFTQAMTLDASGNLGVGITSPAAKLDVYATTGTLFRCENPGKAQLNIGNGNTSTNYYDADLQIFRSGGGTERARITSGGDFLVKWTSYGGGTNTAGAGINPVGQIAVERDGGAAGVFNRYTSDGQLIIFRRSATTVGSIDVTTTATSYVTSSDYRLKNITGPVTNSGAYIDALKPVEGTWKADGSTFVGLIAHEAQEVSRTKVATGTKDGEEMQGMDYSNPEFIANIIAELQSLRARVAQLEAK